MGFGWSRNDAIRTPERVRDMTREVVNSAHANYPMSCSGVSRKIECRRQKPLYRIFFQICDDVRGLEDQTCRNA